MERSDAGTYIGAAHGPIRGVKVEVGVGELIDKITILQIKSERIADPERIANVHRELGALSKVRADVVPRTETLDRLELELRRINESLWEAEDDIRRCDDEGDFGERFVGLARSVYKMNDRRAGLKRQINDLTGSLIVEEKSYFGRSKDLAR